MQKSALVVFLAAKAVWSLPVMMLPPTLDPNCSCGTVPWDCNRWQFYLNEVPTKDFCRMVRDQTGCLCDRCADISFCDCDMPENQTSEPACQEKSSHADVLKPGEVCTPRCPVGSKPVLPRLECREGRLSTPENEEASAIQCVSQPPSQVLAAGFLDRHPNRGQVSGTVAIKAPNSTVATEVMIYFGNANDEPIVSFPIARQRLRQQASESADTQERRTGLFTYVSEVTPEDFDRFFNTLEAPDIFRFHMCLQPTAGEVAAIRTAVETHVHLLTRHDDEVNLELDNGNGNGTFVRLNDDGSKTNIVVHVKLKMNTDLIGFVMTSSCTEVVFQNSIISTFEASVWLPTTLVPEDAASMLVYFINPQGNSTPYRLDFEDVIVHPRQPSALSTFNVTVSSRSHSLALSEVGSEDCSSVGTYPDAAASSGTSLTASFTVSSSGLYTLCGCPVGSKCDDSNPHSRTLGLIAVAGQVSSFTTQPKHGWSGLPLPGNVFEIRLEGSGFIGAEQLHGVGADADCQDTNLAQFATHVERSSLNGSAVSVEGSGKPSTRPSALGSNWTWDVVVPRAGLYKVCVWVDMCDGDSESRPRCRELCRQHAVDIGTIEVAACIAPCATCLGAPDICTSCTDGGLPDVLSSSRDGESPCRPNRPLLVIEKLVEWQHQDLYPKTDAVEVLRQPVACEGAECGVGAELDVPITNVCVDEGLKSARVCSHPNITCCKMYDPDREIHAKDSCYWTQFAHLENGSRYDLFPWSGYRSLCKMEPLRKPAGVAMLTTGNLLIADRAIEGQEFEKHAKVWQTGKLDMSTLSGGLRSLNMLSGNLGYACQKCLPGTMADNEFKGGELQYFCNDGINDERDSKCEDENFDSLHTGNYGDQSLRKSAAEIHNTEQLFAPSAVRVAPAGDYWLVVETDQHKIKRVDAATGKVTSVVGTGVSFVVPKENLMKLENIVMGFTDRAGTSSGDGGKASDAYINLPQDVAIHPVLAMFLVSEGRFRGVERVRLVDEAGLINTVAHLLPEDCSLPLSSVDWVPSTQAISDSFIVACGRLWMFKRSSNAASWGTSPWVREELIIESSTFPSNHSAVSSARVTPDGRILLSLQHAASGGIVLAVASLPIAGFGGAMTRFTILAGGGSAMFSPAVERSWALDTKLPTISGILPALDGSVIFSLESHAMSAVMRVRLGCGRGHGYDHDSRQCQLCPAGTFNDGAMQMNDMCLPCPALETSEAGAEKCHCFPGLFRKDSRCQAAFHSHFAPGTSDDESQHHCGKGMTTLNTSEINVYATNANAAASDSQMQGLYFAPAWVRGSSSPDECGCCFGWYDGAEGQCQQCPDGAWCVGALMSPQSQLKQKNGYWVQSQESAPLALRCAHSSYCWSTPAPLFWRALARDTCQKVRVMRGDCQTDHCGGMQVGAAPGGCPAGREGRTCGLCADGSFDAIQGGDCLSCAESSGLLYPLLLVFALTACSYAAFELLNDVGVQVLYASFSCLGSLLVLVEHVRVLHSMTHLKWPVALKQFIEFAAWTTWHMFPASTKCLVGDAFASRRAFIALAPLALAALPLIVAGCAQLVRGSDSLPAMINVVCVFAAVLFPQWVGLSMSYFQCYRASSPDDNFAAQLWWSSEVSCPSSTQDASDWLSALPWGIIGLSFPLAFVAVQVVATREASSLYESSWASSMKGRYRASALSWDLTTVGRILTLHVMLAMEPVVGFSWVAMLCIAVNIVVLIKTVQRVPFNEATSTWLDVGLLLATIFMFLPALALQEDHVDYTPVKVNISALAVLVVVGYCALVMYRACRDIYNPKEGAKAEADKVQSFLKRLKDFFKMAIELPPSHFASLISSLDPISQEKTLEAFHRLEQVLTVPKQAQATKYRATRLSSTFAYSADIQTELEQDGGSSCLVSSVMKRKTEVLGSGAASSTAEVLAGQADFQMAPITASTSLRSTSMRSSSSTRSSSLRGSTVSQTRSSTVTAGQ